MCVFGCSWCVCDRIVLVVFCIVGSVDRFRCMLFIFDLCGMFGDRIFSVMLVLCFSSGCVRFIVLCVLCVCIIGVEGML